MPGSSLGIFLNTGFPGTYSRNGDCIVTARSVDPLAPYPILFGDAAFIFYNATQYGTGVYRSLPSLSTYFSASTTASSTVLSGIQNAQYLFFGSQTQVGMFLIGPGIPAGTTVVSFTSSSITMSAAATNSVASLFNLVSPVVSPGGFAGVAVREAKTNTHFAQPSNLAFYTQGTQADILQRGSVVVQTTQPSGLAVYQSVFVRIALNPVLPNLPVGGYEAQSDGTFTLALPSCRWTTGSLNDTTGVAEITLLDRNEV